MDMKTKLLITNFLGEFFPESAEIMLDWEPNTVDLKIPPTKKKQKLLKDYNS